VDNRPDESRHKYRIVAADETGVLLIHQGIDQYLESTLRLADVALILRGGLDESPEYHPVVGGVRNREVSVCPGHGFEAGTATAVLFPGIGDGLTEHAEPFAPHRRHQGLFVGKMPVKRAPGEAELPADGSQGEVADAMRLDGAKGLVEQRTSQVSVVVALGGLSFSVGAGRNEPYTRIICSGVDSVNI